MDSLLDVARAARLAGVPSEEIRRRIDEGRLSTVDGKVQVSELVEAFPEIQRSRSKMVEVTGQIKDDAIIKAMRMKQGMEFPDMESMWEELKKVRREAAHYKKQVDHYRGVVHELEPKLRRLQEVSENKSRIQGLISWLSAKLRES